MKKLEDLDAIEQIIDSKTLKKSFVEFNNKVKISPRNITLLTYPPFLVTKIYGDFQKVGNNNIPEEANAFLIGQGNLFFGKNLTELYSASYCKVKKR